MFWSQDVRKLLIIPVPGRLLVSLIAVFRASTNGLARKWIICASCLSNYDCLTFVG